MTYHYVANVEYRVGDDDGWSPLPRESRYTDLAKASARIDGLLQARLPGSDVRYRLALWRIADDGQSAVFAVWPQP